MTEPGTQNNDLPSVPPPPVGAPYGGFPPSQGGPVHSAPLEGAAPPPPAYNVPPGPPPPQRDWIDQPNQGFDFVATLMRWGGPALIVLGMIYGALYLVDTNVFGPPERLVAGIAVTLAFGWLGQNLIKRGHKLLGELVTGSFFAGAFLCSWAIPTVTGWSIGTSILLSLAVGLLALAYSWKRTDSTTFAIGIVGLAGIPLSGPLYSSTGFLDNIAELYIQPQMVGPLMLFAILALGLRVSKGWFLPWALTNIALLISFGFIVDAAPGLGDRVGLAAAMVCLIVVSSLFGLSLRGVDDASPLSKVLDQPSRLIDAAAPLLALLPAWILIDELNIGLTEERIAMAAWAALTTGLALGVYRGVDSWGIKRLVGRQVGAVVSALIALLIAFSDLDWYIYIVIAAAGFVVSIAADNSGRGVDASNHRSDTTTMVVDLIQAALGTSAALGLLLIIASGLENPLHDDLSMMLSGWVAAILLGAGFYLRPGLRSAWGIPYGLSLGLLAASLGAAPTTLVITSGAWLLVGFCAIKFGVIRQNRLAAVIGLSTIAIAVGKFLLVDAARLDSDLMRAVSFLVAGLVIVLVSAETNNIRSVLRSTKLAAAADASQDS